MKFTAFFRVVLTFFASCFYTKRAILYRIYMKDAGETYCKRRRSMVKTLRQKDRIRIELWKVRRCGAHEVNGLSVILSGKQTETNIRDWSLFLFFDEVGVERRCQWM